MTSSTPETIAPTDRVGRHGNVLVITLNRPEARNAVNGAVSAAVGDALAQYQNGPDVWGGDPHGRRRQVLLRRCGPESDLPRGEPAPPRASGMGIGGYAQHFIDKPTIAAVNGTPLGGGSELALASDLVIAEEHAVFGLPEVKRGLIAGRTHRWLCKRESASHTASRTESSSPKRTTVGAMTKSSQRFSSPRTLRKGRWGSLRSDPRSGRRAK